MSTDKTWQIHSASSADTEKFGRHIGSKLRGGEVIELISDLGGGKTTFVRGLAAGIGSKDKVASPTFTVSKVYQGTSAHIVHYDFYRLHDPGLLQYELAETLEDPTAIAVIEWAEIVHDVLPHQRVTIRITTDGENSRSLNITLPAEHYYLMEGNS